MKFLVDVCAGTGLARWLREMGHDVAEVRDVDSRMTDEEVLRWAARERRVVITLDKDFGQLVVASGEVRASIVRLPDVPLSERKQILGVILSKYGKDLEKGSIVTVTGNRVRVRRFGAANSET
ncbi:DUF5615 family PIN-like protein [Ammonifex thiophilus]|uniref:DUF5615 domain-containing protein n=1 Tax=Ammonifex thiophilus TaxID=444093 RepID=A0A3D8P3G9_9THEO|nr:DUF5615 family PIN-like protein [Ammonifex thiophilus]RDV81172.1 hypothetical protein DXX99_09785 [Ammonifex thiophilus]